MAIVGGFPPLGSPLRVSWDAYRRPDTTLDLAAIFCDLFPQEAYATSASVDVAPIGMPTPLELYGRAVSFLKQVEGLIPINSRQAAAVALATARAML